MYIFRANTKKTCAKKNTINYPIFSLGPAKILENQIMKVVWLGSFQKKIE